MMNIYTYIFEVDCGRYSIDELFLEMDFLSSTIEVFRNEKEGDENIINILVFIINKTFDRNSKVKRIDVYKSIDAVDSLYHVMKHYKNNKVKEDAKESIVTIAKKYPSDVINNNNIKDSYKDILPSNNIYSDENKEYIYILLKEMIKEGIIKKGEEGSEIVEEILYIAEMINKNEDIINIKEEELIKEINNYIVIAKEKGFEGKLWKNKNDIIGEEIYIEWIELCKEVVCPDNNSDDSSKEITKEEQKEKIKKFRNYVISHSFDIQMNFINKLYNIVDYHGTHPVEFILFNTNENGLFLYLYLPLLFKIYHLEDMLPKFINRIQDKYEDIPNCFEYIIKLYNEIIERMMKEEKEIEINEENIIIIIFLWSVEIEGKRENEIEYLINSTVKVLEWLGRIEEEEEEIKEDKKLMKKEDKNEEIKRNLNRKEMIIYKLLNIIDKNLDISNRNRKKIKKDGRISKMLLEIIKNHIKNERCLIEKGNKKRIIEYFIYSYDECYDTSNLLSLSSPSFPYSINTGCHILCYYSKYLSNKDNKSSQKEDILKLFGEILNNFVDIMKIIEECDIKKEIEREILIEWNNNIINELYKKIFIKDFYKYRDMILTCKPTVDLSLFDIENNRIIKKLINFCFSHSSNNIHYNEKEKDRKNKEIEEKIFVKPFITSDHDRNNFFGFLCLFTDYEYFSIFNLYFLIEKSEEGCNIINIYMKELSGEIVDRVKKREENNIIKERRRYKREKIDDIYERILKSLGEMIDFVSQSRSSVYLGFRRNKNSYRGKEKEIEEDRNYISDIMEEEDVRECLILYLKHIKEYIDEYLERNTPSGYSKDSLGCLLYV